MALIKYCYRYCLPLLLCVAFIGGFFAPRPWYYADLLFSRDQQGLLYFKQAQYLKAAQRFENPQWRAYAYYAAEQFQPAQQLFATAYDAQAYFNRANALAHQQQYAKAGDYYAMAIALQPDFYQAEQNVALIEVLGRKSADYIDKGSHTEGKLTADNVVFDLKSPDKTSSTADESSDNKRVSQAWRAIWLKGLQTTPADFLQQKFYYQWHAQNQAVERRDSNEAAQ